MPESVRKVQEAEHDILKRFSPRLPKTPEEEKELEELATSGGPKAVYSWIYGADSPMTKGVPFSTWEEAGMDPITGLKQILAGIRQFINKNS